MPQASPRRLSRIGQITSLRPEKGAAVAAAEHLQRTHPELTGFSPRNVRRMRDFYRAYENSPDLLAETIRLGWTLNVVILEGCEDNVRRAWYLRATQWNGWSKQELLV